MLYVQRCSSYFVIDMYNITHTATTIQCIAAGVKIVMANGGDHIKFFN